MAASRQREMGVRCVARGLTRGVGSAARSDRSCRAVRRPRGARRSSRGFLGAREEVGLGVEHEAGGEHLVDDDGALDAVERLRVGRAVARCRRVIDDAVDASGAQRLEDGVVAAGAPQAATNSDEPRRPVRSGRVRRARRVFVITAREPRVRRLRKAGPAVGRGGAARRPGPWTERSTPARSAASSTWP
jgi:hypothetical protein